MSMLANAARGIKNIWSHGEEDDDYADDDILDSDEAPSQTTTPRQSASKYSSDKYSASDKYSHSYGGGSGGGDGASSRARSLRTVPIPLRAKEKNIYTLRPKNQDEAAIAADYMKSGSAVVMNLETVDRAVALRIIDFMSGVCYGLEGQGHAMKLGDSIFLFTPADFEISSDELDYGENRDFFFKSLEGSGNAPQASSPSQAQHPSYSPAQQHSVQARTQPAHSAASHISSLGAHAGNNSPVMSMPPIAPPGSTTPSGYATANYAPPVATASSTPAAPVPVAEPAPVAPPAPAAPARVSTLPASSVYGSGGKAHVLVGGRPATVGAAAPAPTSSYGERRSWER